MFVSKARIIPLNGEE